MIDTTYARRVVEELCRTNGQNTEKDKEIANNLRKDIDTAFLAQGCFINELLQNADDRPGTELPEITFWLRSSDELVVFHNGRAFNEGDVCGICTYGDADNNQKSKDTEQTGYKNIGFKSTFKMAHRVRIWSREWRFSFNEHDPRWNGDKRYPWQNAPLWVEEQSPISGDQRTVFSFSLREGSKVLQELMNFRAHPDNILFLKNINRVAVKIFDDICVLTRQVNASSGNVEIYAKGELFNQWRLCHKQFDMPVEMKDLLSKMGSHVCPEKMWNQPTFTLSVAYSDKREHSVNLYAVLPTAMRTGFPFVVNAPFLLNPSRENLLENDWNVFLIQLIAKQNFEQVRSALSQRYFQTIQFLAMPQMHGVVPNLETVFQVRMQELLNNEPLLPAQFGGHLIKVNDAQIDSTGIYSRFQGAGILLPEETDFPNIVHEGFAREQLLAKFPQIVQLQLKDILARLPPLLLERSKALDLAASIQVVHVLFDLYCQNMIDTGFLQSLRGLVLHSNHESFKEHSYRLYLPACFKPLTVLENYFPDRPELLLNEKYLVGGGGVKLKKFFSAMGVLEECKFDFSPEITIGMVYGAQDVTFYLDYIFKSSSQYYPKTRKGLWTNDTVSQLVWFPYLSHLLASPSYQAFFWQQLQKEALNITNSYSITSFHAYKGVAGHHPVPQTFLQFMFRSKQLIQGRDGIWRTTPELYAPSMDTYNMLSRTAQLPVKLSKEMEDHLGLQKIITVEDCHDLLTRLETEFDYEPYVMILRHLLYNLKNVTKSPDILKKKWRFYADDHSWGSTEELKRWAAPRSHPPEDERKWIDRVDFSDAEFAEFCTFFNIQPILDHAVKIEDAIPNDALKNYLLGKIYDIAYLWKRLNNKRAVKDCYESIFVKINQLTFFILENSKYCDGQILLHNDHCYFASDWEDNKREVAKVLGSYLTFSEKEMVALESALSRNPRRFQRDEAVRFEQFKREFDIYRQSPHLPHKVLETEKPDQTTEEVKKSPPVTAEVQKRPRRPSTGEHRSAEELKRDLRLEDRPLPEEAIMTLPLENIPATGNGPRSLVPHDNQPFNRPIDEFSNRALEFSETTDHQYNGGNVIPNEDQTPQKSATSKPDEENPQRWQRAHSTPEASLISTIHKVPAAVTRTNSTPTRAKPSPSKSGSPSSEESLESKLEKKRIGLWAERHVFESYRIKYEKEFQSKAVIVPGEMTVIDPIKPRKIVVIWKNDPLLRPTENKGDELWDSKSPFDLEIIKTIEDVVTVKKKEVKGTIGKAVHFFLGSSEWQELIKAKPGGYRIHVVTDVKSNKPGKKCYKDLLSEFRTHDELTRPFSYISKTEFTGPVVTVEEVPAK